MSNRAKDAHMIWWGGAANPKAVARALVKAIDDAVAENGGSDGANDPAVHMIIDHLCFLVGLPMPCNVVPQDEWQLVLDFVEEKKNAEP